MSRHRYRLLLAFPCCLSLVVASVRGDLIPNSLKTSASPDAGPINALITAQLQQLGGDDLTAARTARENLISECESHNGNPQSPEYEAAYAMALDKAIAPLLGAKSLRVRLNAAVVLGNVARMTEKTGGSRVLDDAVQIALGDKETPIAIWGMKAAKYVVPSLIQAQGNFQKLEQVIVQSAKSHAGQSPADSGTVIEEAYGALTLEPLRQQAVPIDAAMAASVIPELLNLMQWRADQFANNAALPPNPLAEEAAANFLPVTAFGAISVPGNPPTLNASGKRALQIMSQLACVDVRLIANGNTDADLVSITNRFGSAITAMADPSQLNQPALLQSGKTIAGISASTTAASLNAACAALTDGLKPMGIVIP